MNDPETTFLEVRNSEPEPGSEGAARPTIFRCEEKQCRAFAPGFVESKAPTVSRSGASIAFVGRRTEGGPQAIYVASVDGDDPREIATGNGAPDDLVFLPNDALLFSDRSRPGGGPDSGARSLFVVKEGQAPERITFGDWLDRPLTMLYTGQVIVERKSPGAPAGEEGRRLLLRPDGTGVTAAEPFYQPTTTGPGAATNAPPARIVVRPWRGSRLLSLVDRQKTTGTLLCLDAYATRPGETSPERGTIREVVVTIPPPRADAPTRTLRAPVWEDGSFFLEVPADEQLSVDLVDAAGQRLRSCGSDLWVRPNENRACIGCHELPGQAPPNRFPKALRARSAPSFTPTGRDDE